MALISKLKDNNTEIYPITISGAVYMDDGKTLQQAYNSIGSQGSDSSLSVPLRIDETENADFELADESGNVIARLMNGHIKTKNFDSSTVADNYILERFKGLRVSIIGDSISTFQGTMPSGYAYYYPRGDVQSIDDMWWAKLCKILGMTYTNTSWSGSEVAGAPKGTTAYAACSDKRITDIGRNGAPDIVICYISCNDWGNKDRAVGEWNESSTIVDDSSFSTSDTIDNMADAYALMIKKIFISYPKAKVFCCTNIDDTNRDRTAGYPANNRENVTTQKYNSVIRSIADNMGANVIDFHSCGLNYFNVAQFSVDGIHPLALGHTWMAEKAISEIISKF